MGQRFVDQYSLLHFAVGIVAYFFGVEWAPFLIVHALFEWVENTPTGMFIINTYLPGWPGGKPVADSVINRVGDTLFAMAGWLLGYVISEIGKRRGWYT